MNRKLAEEQLAREEADNNILVITKQLEDYCIQLSEKPIDTKGSLRSRMDKTLNSLRDKVDKAIKSISSSKDNSFKFIRRTTTSEQSKRTPMKGRSSENNKKVIVQVYNRLNEYIMT